MPKIGRNIIRKRARDFGDDPTIRRKHGEAKRYNPQQPWEVQYRKHKKKHK